MLIAPNFFGSLGEAGVLNRTAGANDERGGCGVVALGEPASASDLLAARTRRYASTSSATSTSSAILAATSAVESSAARKLTPDRAAPVMLTRC